MRRVTYRCLEQIDSVKSLCKGKIIWKKCPDCDEDGFQDFEQFGFSECETCEGVGYQFYEVT